MQRDDKEIKNEIQELKKKIDLMKNEYSININLNVFLNKGKYVQFLLVYRLIFLISLI